MSLTEHTDEREDGNLFFGAVAFLSYFRQRVRDAMAVGMALAKEDCVPSPALQNQIRHPLDAPPDVAKRRAVVRRCRNLKGLGLCKRFDLEHVLLPSHWLERYGVSDWRSAYRQPKTRALIQTIISKDKQQAL